MKDRDSRYWIGGEGIPFRGRIGQRGERSGSTIDGFQRKEGTGKIIVIDILLYNIFVYIHGS